MNKQNHDNKQNLDIDNDNLHDIQHTDSDNSDIESVHSAMSDTDVASDNDNNTTTKLDKHVKPSIN